MTLPELLDTRRVVLCVGSGGVGKTTTAAALAVAAARRGRHTVVLTVDPAQRLRDALGIGELDGRPRRVPLQGGARLDAMLLDVKRTFDELVEGLASTPEQARRVLDNRLYQNLSGTLAGSAEYMAVESVLRLAETGDYDLLVVDTPPARHAVDFLDAPRRLLALLDSRAFAILKDPTSILPGAGSRIAHLVLSGVLRGLERFTGIGLIGEIGEFVRAIEDLTGALRARVAQVNALLASDATALVLVTAPEPRLITETEELARALAAVHLRTHGVVVNRVLPRALYGSATGPPAGVPRPLATRLERALAEVRTSRRARRPRSSPCCGRPARPSWRRCRSSPPRRARWRTSTRSPAICCRTPTATSRVPAVVACDGVAGSGPAADASRRAGATPSLRCARVRSRLARLLLRPALRRLEPVDLEAQVRQVALDDLELGQQAVEIGPRRQIQQREHGLHVAVDGALGLEPVLERAGERPGEERPLEQLLGQPSHLVAAQHDRPPRNCMRRGV